MFASMVPGSSLMGSPMRRDLSKYPDKGWWISDDRVNAFVSVAAGGIGEIGFHGSQPVSRNSRLLVHPDGVLTFSLTMAGREHALAPQGVVDLTPATAGWRRRIGEEDVAVSITVAQNMAVVGFPAMPANGASIRISFNRLAMFTQVQGRREWQPPVVADSHIHLRCRDSIFLDAWMKRTGPYAGDFLIPEPIRRMVFQTRRRSGMSTRMISGRRSGMCHSRFTTRGPL
jgi:hypothetical protein